MSVQVQQRKNTSIGGSYKLPGGEPRRGAFGSRKWTSARARLGLAVPRRKSAPHERLRDLQFQRRPSIEKRQHITPTFEGHLFPGNLSKMVSPYPYSLDSIGHDAAGTFVLASIVIGRCRTFPHKLSKLRSCKMPVLDDNHKLTPHSLCSSRSATQTSRFRPRRAPARGALTCVSASRTLARPPRPSAE